MYTYHPRVNYYSCRPTIILMQELLLEAKEETQHILSQLLLMTKETYNAFQ